MLDTPVLFIVFNRPQNTQKVFEVIRKVRPKYLFIAADGPRLDKVEESAVCDQVRQIATSVDWECDLRTLFNSNNLGCGLGPKMAIDWFFENVEQGIILEDDCLPSISFFNFCESTLNLFKNNKDIYHISGTNIQTGLYNNHKSYYFSRVPHMWGWATWRRSWRSYSYKLPNKYHLNLKSYEHHWVTVFDSLLESNDCTIWDYQWVFTILTNDAICITPRKNLVLNIGFNEDATHTSLTPSWYKNVALSDLYQLKHPTEIKVNTKADKRVIKLLFGKLSFLDRLYIRLLGIFKI
jgi:hypothetical protein